VEENGQIYPPAKKPLVPIELDAGWVPEPPGLLEKPLLAIESRTSMPQSGLLTAGGRT